MKKTNSRRCQFIINISCSNSKTRVLIRELRRFIECITYQSYTVSRTPLIINVPFNCLFINPHDESLGEGTSIRESLNIIFFQAFILLVCKYAGSKYLREDNFIISSYLKYVCFFPKKRRN